MYHGRLRDGSKFIHRVPGPELATGGGEDFFEEKRGNDFFFRKKARGEGFLYDISVKIL